MTPAIAVEVFRNDELLTTTDAQFSFFDTESVDEEETSYRVRTLDSAGNPNPFSNTIVVNRTTREVQGNENNLLNNPRPEGIPRITSIFATGQNILQWTMINDDFVAGYEIRLNNEPVDFVASNIYIVPGQGFDFCDVLTVAAISTSGNIVDFRSLAIDGTSFTGARACQNSL